MARRTAFHRCGGSIRATAIAVVVLITAVATAGDPLDGFQAEPAAALVKPNIVMILTDDMTFEALGKMPYTNGRSDWIRFNRAYHNNPLCCPSRATLLSGLYSHHTGVEDNTLGEVFDESNSVATWLESAGYRNALFGKYFNGYPFDRGDYVPAGWSRWATYNSAGSIGNGYFNYTLYDDRVGLENHGSAPEDYSTDVLASKAVDFINETTGPFFLKFAPFAPHLPRVPAPRHANTFAGTPVARTPNLNEGNVNDKPLYVRSRSKVVRWQVEEDRRETYRTLLAVDDAVRSMFGALEARGVLDNTVVIFSSDNGYMLGEHRLVGKRCEYEECVRNPLLIRYPGKAGRTVTDLVSNVDVAPTIGALAGASVPEDRDGVSLVPLLEGTVTSWRTGVLLHNRYFAALVPGEGDEDSRVPTFWAVRTADWKYVELGTGEKELYNMKKDPYELNNLANTPAQLSRQNALAAQLGQLRS